MSLDSPAWSIMKLAISFVLLILIVLIKIGDCVIWLFQQVCHLLAFLASTLFHFVRNLVAQVSISITSFVKKVKKRVRRTFLMFSRISSSLRLSINTRTQQLRKLFSRSLTKLQNIKPPKVAVVTPDIDPVLQAFHFKQPKKRGRKPKSLAGFPVPILLKFRYFIAGIVFSLTFVFLPLLITIFLQDLPNPRTLTLSQNAQTTKLYDRNGKLLYQFYANQNRTVVPLSDIPLTLRQATIAVEDKNFYNHPGFDVTAIVRSFLQDVSGKDFQGGSTITQQLIKSALLSPETSISRKIKEVVLAFWTERTYSKNQILELYFNQVPYGGTAWGAEAGAQTYFGKSVKELDLAQAAFLAGIPRAPTIYSPYGTTPHTWKKRQTEVLYKMVDQKYITRKQAEEAVSEELVFQSPRTPIYAPHFVMYVKDYLTKKYGLSTVEKGGLSVITTLDLSIQDMAQQVVSDEVTSDAYLNLTNGAAMVTSPRTGDILAMVGSHDFSEPKNGNVNLTTSLRQPGSSIKVVTYAAALSRGFTAATIIDDSQTSFSTGGGTAYSPVNYDGKFHGRVPLRLALGNSFNIPAVRTLNQIGVPTMVNLGKQMGIKSWGEPDQYGLAITLGAAETTMVDMATVFGTLANDGNRVDINPILKITDSRGSVLEEKTNPSSQRVLDPGVAYIMSNILSDNSARTLEFGSNSPLFFPGQYVSVKTGTSDNKRDNWTLGYTKDYLVSVWVGNNDNTPMSPSLASGITGAAPIWHKIMENMIANKVNAQPPLPDDIVTKNCLGRTEYFVRGTENTVNCSYVAPKPSPSKKPEQKPQ